jgi:hypothetical protein
MDLRATLAQLVERLIRNQQVAGSIPAGGSTPTNTYQTTTALHASACEPDHPCNREFILSCRSVS